MTGLIDRLLKARCVNDEHCAGYRVTRWWHLVPSGIDAAVEEIRNLRQRVRGLTVTPPEGP